MKNEEWRMKNEEWRMKNEEWRMKNEEWRMKNEEWRMKNEEWRMKNEEWRMKNEEWRMKNEEWRMKNEEWRDGLKLRYTGAMIRSPHWWGEIRQTSEGFNSVGKYGKMVYGKTTPWHEAGGAAGVPRTEDLDFESESMVELKQALRRGRGRGAKPNTRLTDPRLERRLVSNRQKKVGWKGFGCNTSTVFKGFCLWNVCNLVPIRRGRAARCSRKHGRLFTQHVFAAQLKVWPTEIRAFHWLWTIKQTS